MILKNKPLLAILKKELMGHFNSLTAYIFICVFLVVLTYLYFQGLFLMGQVSMRQFFTLLPWFFLFLIPALSMKIWAEEKRLGTIENILTLPIADSQTVIAKFLGSFLFIGVTLLFSLGIPISLSRMGDLDWGPVIGSYLGAWLLGGAYLALGQFLSSLTKNQIVAFLITIVSAFIFIIIGLPFVLQKSGVLAPVLFTLSTITHFENMAKGVIDLRDIIYFLSFIGVFLYLNVYALIQRHWK